MNGLATIQRGFMPAHLGSHGLTPGESMPLFNRGFDSPEIRDLTLALERGDSLDQAQMATHLASLLAGINRGITSGMTAFPVRENLEAEVTILVPTDTPMRNRIPRVPGAGTAAAWRQLTSLGGGWGTSVDQPGGGSATRSFFAEAGAPAEFTSVYAAKSAGYKLMGILGSVTGFAMASGANFQNQLAKEKTNAIWNLMLIEENALVNGDATSTAAPWGDGTSALAFNGLVNLITTANGTPTANVQTAVGALTLAHVDAQLTRIWKQGARKTWMLLNAQEQQSLKNLAQASGSIHRLMIEPVSSTIGFRVTGYVHPVTGEVVEVITSKFLAAGTMLFGCDYVDNGAPTLEVDVLPQVMLPELAPNAQIQGYTAQELAPTTAAPQVYPFIVSCYEVLKMKAATVFAKSTGVTAV